jgi:hypothetical protein
MEIPHNNQLVPYYPELREVTAGIPKALPAVSAAADRSSEQNSLLLLPVVSGKENRPDRGEPAYNSNRRLTSSKVNQVGFLIDIYA